MKISELLEAATAGATSAGAIATVSNPLFSPGRARGKKSYTGTPGVSGWKSPPQPKPKRQRPGTNALDITSVGLFGQPLRKSKKRRKKK